MADRQLPAGFWARLGERERKALLATGQDRRVAAGRRLFEEGRGAPSLVVILQGRVKVSTVTPGGDEHLLALRGEGDLLGEMATLTGRVRTATVTAIDAVRVLVVPSDSFQTIWRREPVVLEALVWALVHRVEEADRSRLELLEEAPVRVRRLLADLARRWSRPEPGGGRRIDLALTQGDLASLACTSRGVVASVLGQLRHDGIVRTGRRRIVVVDLARLDVGEVVP